MKNHLKSHSIMIERLRSNKDQLDLLSLRELILNVLMEDYRYPKKLRENKIFVTPEMSGATLPNQYGIVLVNSNKTPYGFISVVSNESGDIENELFEVFEKYPTISLGMATNGLPGSTSFLRRNNYSGTLEYIADFDFAFQDSSISRKLINNTENIDNNFRPLCLLTDEIENLFFDIHSNLRDTDGLHPDEALDELSKLIQLKLYDEINTPINHETFIQKSIYSSKEEMACSIREIFREANHRKLQGQSKSQQENFRADSNTNLRLSSNALYNSVLALERFAISKSKSDLRGRAFQKVLDKVVRYGMGQYFTPEPIVNLVVDICQPKINDNIIDPFCGSAHFLTRSLKFVAENQKNEDSAEFIKFTNKRLHGIEKSDRMVRIVKTELLLTETANINLQCSDSLLEFSNYPDLEPESFDLVLTNPPFGSQLTNVAIQQLGSFELAEGKQNVPLEILGLERCIQLAKPGGKIAIIIPDSVLSNKATNYVRNWIATKAKLISIISLPIETFTPFGANIKTSILFLRKWELGEVHSNNYEVTLAKVENVGYDLSGRTTNKCDLQEVAQELKALLEKNGW